MIPKVKILEKKKKMNKLPGNIIFLYILVYYKWRSYDIQSSWNIRCNRQKFLSFWAIFCPFSRLTTWKIEIFKLKKTPGDIIILHIFTINDNYMKYGSWDMERSRQNFFVILDRFLYFYPPNNSKNQNFIKMKKKKKSWRYYHFTQVYQKSWSYALLFLWYGA